MFEIQNSGRSKPSTLKNPFFLDLPRYRALLYCVRTRTDQAAFQRILNFEHEGHATTHRNLLELYLTTMVRFNAVMLLLVVAVIMSSLMSIHVVTALADYNSESYNYLSSHTRSNHGLVGVVVRPSSYINRYLLSIRAGDIQVITSLTQIEDIIEKNQAVSSEENGQLKLIVLDFTANNCPPCDMIGPIYMDLSNLEEFENKVIFLKVNVNDHPDIAEKYGVDGWPTFLLFKNGKLVDSVVGGQAAKSSLYNLVAKHA